MTYTGVSRLIVAIAAALGAAAVAFAVVTTRPSAPAPPASAAAAPGSADVTADQALFEARCGGCHERESLVAYLRSGPDIATRQRQMEALLASHGPATGDEIPRIVGYLAALAAG